MPAMRNGKRQQCFNYRDDSGTGLIKNLNRVPDRGFFGASYAPRCVY